MSASQECSARPAASRSAGGTGVERVLFRPFCNERALQF
jgi:hypothetical protein